MKVDHVILEVNSLRYVGSLLLFLFLFFRSLFDDKSRFDLTLCGMKLIVLRVMC